MGWIQGPEAEVPSSKSHETVWGSSRLGSVKSLEKETVSSEQTV